MVAEWTDVFFEKDQDSRTYMTGDAGERTSRIPGWHGDADTYFFYARRARQFVEGTKTQELYLCGPRLEAQLTGKPESAVEGCRPVWLSQEHGVKTLLSFLRTHCATLALHHTRSHLEAIFCKLERKKYEPMASWCTRYRNENTMARRVLARLQRTEAPEDTELQQPYISRQEDQDWNEPERNSEELVERDRFSEAGSSAWSKWNWISWKGNQEQSME